MNPKVPKFKDHWTEAMVGYIQGLDAVGVEVQNWIRTNIQDICDSWGDPYKPYAVERVLYEFELNNDPTCSEALEQWSIRPKYL